MDTLQYFKDYMSTPDITDITYKKFETSRFQPLWIYYVSSIKYLLNDFSWILIIQSLFINLVLFRFFRKYTSYPFLCITIYFISYYIEFNTEILRESIALSFILLAYEQYKSKHWIPAIILWFVGFNFHVSAVIALLYPLLDRIKYSRKNVIRLTVIGSLILLLFPFLSKYNDSIQNFLELVSPTMSERFSLYNNTEFNTSLNVFYYLKLFVVTLIIPIICLSFLKGKTDQYFGFIALYIIFQILTAFSYGFYRFANYEAAFYIIFVSTFIYTFLHHKCKDKASRLVFYACFVIVSLYIFQSMQLNKEPNSGKYRYERYIPYKFNFEE